MPLSTRRARRNGRRLLADAAVDVAETPDDDHTGLSQNVPPDYFFRDGKLIVKGYKFEPSTAWGDPGSSHLIAEGVRLEGRNELSVLAKIGDGTTLEREAHILSKLAKSIEGSSRTLRILEMITIPPVDGGVKVLILKHPGDNALARYFARPVRRVFLAPGTRAERRGAAQHSIERVSSEDMEHPDIPSFPPVVPDEPEPVPMTDELSPVKDEPVPVPDHPVSLTDEPVPAPDEPAPVPDEPAPVPDEPAPVPDEPVPVTAMADAAASSALPTEMGFSEGSAPLAGPVATTTPSGAELASKSKTSDAKPDPKAAPFGSAAEAAGDDEDSAEAERGRTIDLSSFLYFAMQAARSLEMLHASYGPHGDVRPDAFHWQASSDSVRLAHFGNRTLHPDMFGGTAQLILETARRPAEDQTRIADALSFLAPEQTGHAIWAPDARTDLYGLGATFWRLLAGRRMFTGTVRRILADIVTRTPPLLHVVRPDVPLVVSRIIHKLLAKDPEERYASISGLKEDLLECSRKLGDGWANPAAAAIGVAPGAAVSPGSRELIRDFPLGRFDQRSLFTFSSELVGREQESRTLQRVIREFAAHYLKHETSSGGGGSSRLASQHSGSGASVPSNESLLGTVENVMPSGVSACSTPDTGSSQDSHASFPLRRDAASGLFGLALETMEDAGLRAVIVRGSAGSGKSALVTRQCIREVQDLALVGHGKFDPGDMTPYSALAKALSAVFRQFLTLSHLEIITFGERLRVRLGPQLSNIPLIYSFIPELREIAAEDGAGRTSGAMADMLGMAESRVRFENLMVDIVSELSLFRMITLFLDDLQNADAPSLSLIEAFSRARVNILLLCTARSSGHNFSDRLASVLGARLTFINLQPLTSSDVSEIVSKTLHISSEAALPLVASLQRHSHGNAFTIKSLLHLLRTANCIVFHWATNSWTFEPDAVNEFMENRARADSNSSDSSFLLRSLQALTQSTQRLLAVAAAIGPVFDLKLASEFMEDESSPSDNESGSDDPSASSDKFIHSWVSALQNAVTEGLFAMRSRDQYAFTHDRQREAALVLAEHQPGGLAAISARLVDMLLEVEPEKRDVWRISDYILRCIPILCQRPVRQKYVDTVLSAGAEAYSRGALESALIYYQAAHNLAGEDVDLAAWPELNRVSFKLAELYGWKGDLTRSDTLLAKLTDLSVEEKVEMIVTRSRNEFSRGELASGTDRLLAGLQMLGIPFKRQYDDQEVANRYADTRKMIVDIGLDKICEMALTTDSASDLQDLLLSEVFIFAYYVDPLLARMIAFEAISRAIEHGLSAHNGLAFVGFAYAAVAVQEYELAVDVGRLAIMLSSRHSTHIDKARVHVFFSSTVAPSDKVHLSQTWELCGLAYKHARAGGDVLWAGFSQIQLMATRFFTSQALFDTVRYGDQVIEDLAYLPPDSDTLGFVHCIRHTARAIAGLTVASSPETIFDSDDWDDRAYLTRKRQGETVDTFLTWYYSYQICALFCLGFHQAAADLGEFTYRTAYLHPAHRHNQLALTYSGLSLCALARETSSEGEKEHHLTVARRNLERLHPWLACSEINIAQWYHLLAAEIASTAGDPEAFVIYDKAIMAAEDGQWRLEHGWALFLAGSHMDRRGAKTMATMLWHQSLRQFNALEAAGITRRLSNLMKASPSARMGAPSGSIQRDIGIQTDEVDYGTRFTEVPSASDVDPTNSQFSQTILDYGNLDDSLERAIQHLSPKDIAVLIHSLQAIATDVNLSSSLERLTVLMMDTTSAAAEQACIFIREDDHNDIKLYTHQLLGKPVVTFDPALALDDAILSTERILVSVVQHVLHSGEALNIPKITHDPRFRDDDTPKHNSVLLVPIHRQGITHGVLYLAAAQEYAFTEGDVLVLALLATQAGVLVSNDILFASLRRSQQVNLRAISEQRTALEAARRSREEAIQATRVKSIFLAQMSHELRTPFASFYGLLGLLVETDLDDEQRELVSTARQSCELLLETISALLDFSKLEAQAVKLAMAPLSPADMIADCQELLLTLASQKGLELTYSIASDVPPCIEADGPRIRQVLQNLMGNALKFTLEGSVDTSVSIDSSRTIESKPDEIVIRIDVQDTGIGISKTDIARLFLPFSQADQSATKRFGGTGLGLSICRELLTLMGGKVSVTSILTTGSCFTCLIPVRVSSNMPEALKKQLDEIEAHRQTLLSPQPSIILACSKYESTRTLLESILEGLRFKIFSTIADIKVYLEAIRDFTPSSTLQTERLDVPEAVILDSPREGIDEVVGVMNAIPALKSVPVVQLSARSANNTVSIPHLETDPVSPRVTRCSKPLRPISLLSILAHARVTSQSTLDSVPTQSKSSTLQPVAAISPSRKLRRSTMTPKVSDNFTEEQLEYFKTVHVLVAEDNPVAQKLLVRQLQSLGFIVTAASNGAKGIEFWAEHDPGYFTMALFDHHMPICDGLTAARSIRTLETSLKTQQALPIISLTADAQSSAKDECLAAGMQHYLTKPLRADDLVRLVREFVLPHAPPAHSSDAASNLD